MGFCVFQEQEWYTSSVPADNIIHPMLWKAVQITIWCTSHYNLIATQYPLFPYIWNKAAAIPLALDGGLM